MRTKAETKQQIKNERKRKLQKFREEYLPKIKSMFDVKGHGPTNAPNTMYKVFINNKVNYDFYPMSERICKHHKKKGNKWNYCSARELLNGLNRIYKEINP